MRGNGSVVDNKLTCTYFGDRPTFTVSKYARTMSDRTILKHIFSKISQRHHMRIVDTAAQNLDLLWQASSNAAAKLPSAVFFA